jgi:hypothetical protein
MILKEKLDAKGEMVLNGKYYWMLYRKMPNILNSIKLIKETADRHIRNIISRDTQVMIH